LGWRFNMAEPAIAVKGITKVFDANTPHPVTALDNVGFSLKMLGRDEKETTKTVEEMLELVKMKEFAHRKPTQLSGASSSESPWPEPLPRVQRCCCLMSRYLDWI